MLDLRFAISSGRLPPAHAQAIAAALEAALPWLAATPRCGVHPLKLAAGGTEPLLSPRTRLTLRVPRLRSRDAAGLAGRDLPLHDGHLLLGAAQPHELLPWSALYADCVLAPDGTGELAFVQAVRAELDALGIAGRLICGLPRRAADGTVRGWSLMVDRLSQTDSLALQQHGIGAGRRCGCGLFVPHRSAAAVGAAA